METSWQQLKALFLEDDGSLPDIYVEPLSDTELISTYNYIRSISTVPDDATLWSKSEERDVLISEIGDPVERFIGGDVELSRHGLIGLKVDGVEIPQLTVELSTKQLSFDYKPGADWGVAQLGALFTFLRNIKEIAPEARVFQADEGCYDNPNKKFEEVFSKWLQDAS